MLTSIFSKSKPVNFVLVALYLSVFYFFANASEIFPFAFLITLREIGVLLVLILSLLVLNFISGKNELTGRNAFKNVLFTGFACMILPSLQNDTVILSNLFILLAFRRIISLRSHKDSIKKIFDATLWIGLASIFYFWSILFLFLLYFARLVHVGHRFKNWLVPLVSLLALFSLATATDLLITDTFFTLSDWYRESSFDFSSYREPFVLFPVAFLITLSLWSFFFYGIVIQKSGANSKTSLFLVLLSAFVALAVAILAPEKNGSELLFYFAPLAIIVTNYFQIQRDKWFREILFGTIILSPIFLLIFFS